jgi:hypothetical protein
MNQDWLVLRSEESFGPAPSIGLSAFVADLRSPPPAAAIRCLRTVLGRECRLTGALTTRLGAAPRPQPSDAKQSGARGGLCIRTPLGRRHCAVKSNPQGDRAAADRSRNFTFMGSDYPLTHSSIINIGSSHVQTAWCESRRRSSLVRSSLVRYLLCLIGVSRRGGGIQSRWPNRWRRTTRAKRLVRGIAVFVLCASLLVACGSGGGGGYGGGGGPTTTTTTGTTTTSTTGMTTTTT